METNHKLALVAGSNLNDAIQYRRLVGRLVYLTITRPELCYAVHVLSQFMHNPKKEHMEAAKRVLRYLKGVPGQGLLQRSNSDLRVYAYCDADWGALSSR